MPKKGYTQTPEHREKIRTALAGRKLTNAHRRRIAQAMFRYRESQRLLRGE